MTYTQNLKSSVQLKKIIVIGASTGGPMQIEKIIHSLGELNNTSIIIAQHMARGFIPSFAKRLRESNKTNEISMATDMQDIQAGYIYLCNGITKINHNSNSFYFTNTTEIDDGYNPDINELLNSLVPYAQSVKTMCIILTGIGDDGVIGCKNLALKGASTITQTAQSAIVDGMPSRAREMVPNINILSLEDIIEFIKRFVNDI